MDKFMDYVYLFNSIMLIVYLISYFRLRKMYNNLIDFTMRLSDDSDMVEKENKMLKDKLRD
jgi:hypothetical protein